MAGSIDITRASIAELQHALSTTNLTSVDLVSLCLRRVAVFDYRGPLLNSICVLNTNALKEAQNSDEWRASGHLPRPLEGIPFTVKDSFGVEGMSVAAGSPAFAGLKATRDAAVVEKLRRAGAVLIGKTNMPPMADGGAQRGLYGRSTSPYNPVYLSTGWASGSSYGSGVATTATFALIGIGGEAVSSGRAPASNNALVGYAPSRGVIAARGLWPLYPTCDIVAPHSKSIEDLLTLLDVIVNEDESFNNEFWRVQNIVAIPSYDEIRPSHYPSLKDASALQGKRIAVPKCYIGKRTSSGYAAHCSDATRDLWFQAKADLESLGATVVETDFPLVENYQKESFPGQSANIPGVTEEWIRTERCQMIGMAWDDYLRYNNHNPSTVLEVDPSQLNPGYAPMDDPKEFTEEENQVLYADMINFVKNRPATLYDLPGCKEALVALEAARKRDLEDWMTDNGYDLVVFPTNGDVGLADAENTREALLDALRDGVKYSNGNRALKHLGVPALTVPMGTLADKKMPVGLTFTGKAWSDNDLLRYAFAYENATKLRESPPAAPALDTDVIHLEPITSRNTAKLQLSLEYKDVEKIFDNDFDIRNVSLAGSFHSADPAITLKEINVFTNEHIITPATIDGEKWIWKATLKRPFVHDLHPIPGKVPRDQFLIIVKARASSGQSTALLLLED